MIQADNVYVNFPCSIEAKKCESVVVAKIDERKFKEQTVKFTNASGNLSF